MKHHIKEGEITAMVAMSALYFSVHDWKHFLVTILVILVMAILIGAFRAGRTMLRERRNPKVCGMPLNSQWYGFCGQTDHNGEKPVQCDHCNPTIGLPRRTET